MKFAAIGLLGSAARRVRSPSLLPESPFSPYASPYGAAHPFSRADREWIEWIAKRSRGSIRIQPVLVGRECCRSEHSMTELRHGVVDIGLITPIYVRGGTPSFVRKAAFLWRG
jgi:hypothetical protein